MGRLGSISGAAAVKAFRKLGWSVAGQVGSHVVLVKHNAGISVDEFLEQVR